MRASPEGNIAVDDNVSRAPSCKFGYSGCEHVGWAAVTIGEEQDVGVTSRRDREGPEAIDAEGNTGPSGRGIEMMGRRIVSREVFRAWYFK